MKNFKEDFEAWFYKQEQLKNQLIESGNENWGTITIFENMTQSMQFGVYVDFFDSVGIEIFIWKHLDGFKTSNNQEPPHLSFDPSKPFKTRPEAREKAIEKAIDLFCKQ